MTPDLSDDEFALLAKLPKCDDEGEAESLGNVSARRLLGWAKPKYEKARAGLLDKGMVKRAHGRGGALRRLPGWENVTLPASRERKLYPPLIATLRGDWSDERSLKPLHIEVTADGGSADTGGRWTRPDLVAVGLRGFTYVPDTQFELITFEVKRLSDLDVIAVYEAVAHRRASTHSYVLLELPGAVAKAQETKVERVAAVAREQGVGIVTFGDPNDFETWEEIIPARRWDSPPEALNEFIEKQVSHAGRQTIVAELATWQRA